eukprot:g33246.t2
MMINLLQNLGIIGTMSVPWPVDLAGFFSFMEVFTFDIDSLAFACIGGAQPVWRYIFTVCFFPVGILWLALCGAVSRCIPRLQSWDPVKVRSTIGQFLQVGFSTMSSTALVPLVCYSHPSGQRSNFKNPNIICGSEPHTVMVIFGSLLLAFGVCGFLALCAWLAYMCPTFSSPLLAMSAVIFPDSAAIQIFCCQIILIFYICVQVYSWPWKAPMLNIVDFVTCLALAILVVLTGLYAGAEAVPSDRLLSKLSRQLWFIPAQELKDKLGALGIYDLKHLLLGMSVLSSEVISAKDPSCRPKSLSSGRVSSKAFTAKVVKAPSTSAAASPPMPEAEAKETRVCMASRWAPSSGNARQDDGKESGGLGTGVVQDTEGAVFGGFASHTWHVAQRHFGHADCFVFRFEEDLQVHRWAGLNSYFLFADASGLKLGGGRHPALWIDRDFLRGASGPCETFGTAGALHGVVPELSGDFVVKTFECWGFDCLDPPKEDTGWERRQAGAWQAGATLEKPTR